MAWAKEIALSDGTNPEGGITREQLATMLYRYAKICGLDVEATGDMAKFSDSGAVSEYAAEAVKWAIGTGLLSGKGNNCLNPRDGATRAEVATILMRFCENVAP